MTTAAAKIETRDMPMLELRGAYQPSTFNDEQRTVDIVWTTGAKGLRRTWMEDYFEELAVTTDAVRMDRLNGGAPVLAAHDSYSLDSVIGVVERAWIENGEGKATIRFSERAEVQPIMQDVKSGILRNISVGYQVHSYERIKAEEKGQPDTYRAVDWEPMELSIVPIPFDAGAQVRSAQPVHSVIITTRGTAATVQEEIEMVDTVTAPVVDKPAEQPNVDAIRAEATAAERTRVTEIRSAVAKAGIDAKIAEKLIADGVAIDAARAQIIDAMAEKQAAEQPNIRGQLRVESGDDRWIEGARNWIFEKASVRHLVDKDKKLDGGEFRGLRMVDLARMSLERHGVDTRGMLPMELVGMAMTRGSAYNGVSDFAVLLESAMHKTLLGAYATVADTWRRFCAVGSVSDFRAHNRYRLGSFGTLDALNEHGEYKNKQIPDGAKESITATTKGNIIGLTRQAIINDDMGAFNSLAARFGRAAALSVEVDVYAALALNSGAGPALADGNPVFYNRGTGKNNITTSAALTAAALDLDRQAMASLTDISGNEYLDLRPEVMLVPLTLGSTAREINKMEFNEESNKQNRRPNSVRDLFRDIVDTPRISGNRRYLFADPNIAPVIEVAFLDGQQTPFMDNQNGWRVDGVEWKVRLDYGVAGVGYEGAITNAGG